MASAIDETKPVSGTPTTQSVRDNFAAAKSEIEALQSGKSDASHEHSGTYEPADATILKDADIGVSVAAQGHNHDASYLATGAIGTTVQGYDAATAKTDVGQTFTRPQKAGTLALTHNTAWDGSITTGAQHLTVNVNGATFTIANPSAHTDGVTYKVAIHFTTAHGVALGSAFKGLTGYVATSTAGADDTLLFRSNGTNLICEGYAMNGGA